MGRIITVQIKCSRKKKNVLLGFIIPSGLTSDPSDENRQIFGGRLPRGSAAESSKRAPLGRTRPSRHYFHTWFSLKQEAAVSPTGSQSSCSDLQRGKGEENIK